MGNIFDESMELAQARYEASQQAERQTALDVAGDITASELQYRVPGSDSEYIDPAVAGEKTMGALYAARSLGGTAFDMASLIPQVSSLLTAGNTSKVFGDIAKSMRQQEAFSTPRYEGGAIDPNARDPYVEMASYLLPYGAGRKAAQTVMNTLEHMSEKAAVKGLGESAIKAAEDTVKVLGAKKPFSTNKIVRGIAESATGNALATAGTGGYFEQQRINPDGTVSEHETSMYEKGMMQLANIGMDAVAVLAGKGYSKLRGADTRTRDQIAKDFFTELSNKGDIVFLPGSNGEAKNITKAAIENNKVKSVLDSNNIKLEDFVDDSGYIDVEALTQSVGKDKAGQILNTIKKEVGTVAARNGDEALIYSRHLGGSVKGKMSDNGFLIVDPEKSTIDVQGWARKRPVATPAEEMPVVEGGKPPKDPSSMKFADSPEKLPPVLSEESMFGYVDDTVDDGVRRALTNVSGAYDEVGNMKSEYSDDTTKRTMVEKATERSPDVQAIVSTAKEINDPVVAPQRRSLNAVEVDPTATSKVMLNIDQAIDKLLETRAKGGADNAHVIDALKFMHSFYKELGEGAPGAKFLNSWRESLNAKRTAEGGGRGTGNRTDTEQIIFDNNGYLNPDVKEAVKVAVADELSRIYIDPTRGITPNGFKLSASAVAKKAMNILGVKPKKGVGASDTLNEIEGVLTKYAEEAYGDKANKILTSKSFDNRKLSTINISDSKYVQSKVLNPVFDKDLVEFMESTGVGSDSLSANTSSSFMGSLMARAKETTRKVLGKPAEGHIPMPDRSKALEKYSSLIGEQFDRPDVGVKIRESNSRVGGAVKNTEAYAKSSERIVSLAERQASQKFVPMNHAVHTRLLENIISEDGGMSEKQIAAIIGKEGLYSTVGRKFAISDIEETIRTAQEIVDIMKSIKEIAKKEGKKVSEYDIAYDARILENLRVMLDNAYSPQAKNLALFFMRPKEAYKSYGVGGDLTFDAAKLSVASMLETPFNKLQKIFDENPSAFTRTEEGFINWTRKLREEGIVTGIKSALFARDALELLVHMREKPNELLEYPFLGEIDQTASVFGNVAAINGIRSRSFGVVDRKSGDFRKTIVDNLTRRLKLTDNDIINKQTVKDLLNHWAMENMSRWISSKLL